MHNITTIVAFLLYIYICVCSLMTPCNRTLWYGKYTRGLRTPQYGVKSPNTFTSTTPRSYSIICISSESCLWSNVGFARLLCFGTLRSAISAKVALGELLYCVPVLPDEHLSTESRKLIVMIRRELVNYLRGCKILKDFFRIMR